MALDLLGIQTSDHLFQLTNHNFTVSTSFKRTGHARFRRGPSVTDSHAPSTSTQSAPAFLRSGDSDFTRSVTDTTSSSSRSTSTNSSSLLSPLTGGIGEEGSVSNGTQFSGLGIVAPTPAFSSRKPPLPSSHRKRCRSERPSVSLNGSRSEDHSGCHCCKRRKISSKRVIKRVPITGSKVTSIPADDYSWRKYGEKRIDGSPNPRVYYKCNAGKGCPARKSVEIAVDDTKVLVVTYAGEHVHRQDPVVILTCLTGSVVQSK